MRIAWCTPFSRRSAIGRFSSLVIEELRRLAEVDVWYPQTTEPLETSVRRVTPLTAGPADIARLETYDFAVYNMGNHLGNHREIFEASRLAPGLVVLHDLVLQEFFHAYSLQDRESKDRYIATIRRWYGARGVAAISDLTGGISTDFMESSAVLQFPLFEEAIAGAYGVITHSEFSADTVRGVFPGLVRHLPLPYNLNRKAHIPARETLGVPSGRALAITIGDVNPNKRIGTVLEALGKHPALAAGIFYVVIGNPVAEYKPELMRLVKRYGLERTVSFLGYASEEVLAAYLTHADFCITLRYPARETASASAIEQLFYGKPLIVSNTGFYEELPGDCACKVRIDREGEDLAAALEQLVNEPSLRRQMGEHARAYAEENFRADRYARGVVEMGAELLDAKPLLAFTDRIGKQLDRMGAASDLPIVSTVAAVSNSLFGK